MSLWCSFPKRKPSFLGLFEEHFQRHVMSQRSWIIFQDMYGSLDCRLASLFSLPLSCRNHVIDLGSRSAWRLSFFISCVQYGVTRPGRWRMNSYIKYWGIIRSLFRYRWNNFPDQTGNVEHSVSNNRCWLIPAPLTQVRRYYVDKGCKEIQLKWIKILFSSIRGNTSGCEYGLGEALNTLTRSLAAFGLWLLYLLSGRFTQALSGTWKA